MAKSNTPPAAEPEIGPPALSGRKREEVIRVEVLTALGCPAGLYRVAVVPLWDNNFRVNVVTGDETSGVLIPNSFFVKADDVGKVLGSEPSIRKLY